MTQPAASLCQCTILFEEPFWVAVFERHDERGYAVARTVFGAEPTDGELAQYILSHYHRLRFSQPSATAGAPTEKSSNFKRAQRRAKKMAGQQGVSTKAQAALQLELERHKKERQECSKAERDAAADRKFKLRQARKKEKKQGH